jgi:hypothetical protein
VLVRLARPGEPALNRYRPKTPRLVVLKGRGIREAIRRKTSGMRHKAQGCLDAEALEAREMVKHDRPQRSLHAHPHAH